LNFRFTEFSEVRSRKVAKIGHSADEASTNGCISCPWLAKTYERKT
jgi:hypothetical protein